MAFTVVCRWRTYFIGKVIDELNKKRPITRGGVMFLLGIIQVSLFYLQVY